MTPILHLTQALSVTAAAFLIASLWQGLVVTACVAMLLRLLPSLSAAVRSAIWTAVLVMVILFPALSIFLHQSSASTITPIQIIHVSDRWSLALLSAWAALSLLRISQLIASAFRLQHLATRSLSVLPSESIIVLLRTGNRRAELCASTEIDRPSVTGFFRPRILVPPELLTTLSASELEQVVAHEMEHLRRYDDWSNLLQKLSLALIPLHPVLLWLDRQMCLQRELACDDSVLRQTRSRKAYASCLARLAEGSLIRRGFSLALGALGNRSHTSELTQRVHRILRAPEKTMPRRRAFLATAALLTTATLCMASLARSPQFVSFTSATQPTISALSSTTLPSTHSILTPHFEPASFTTASYEQSTTHQATLNQTTPHPQLLKAILPQQSAPSFIPAVTHRTKLHPPLARNIVQRTTRTPRPYLTLTTWQPVATPTHLIPAIALDSQFLYAAVPTPDGWLLIQL